MTERAEVIVVGGGQAGLTAGYYLTQGQDPVRDPPRRVARRRLVAETVGLADAVHARCLQRPPGVALPRRPRALPAKDEVAGYLERYAHTLGLPIRYDSRVSSLEPAYGGYRLQTQSGSHQAARVIVATGAYQRPYIPPISEQLGQDVTQLHSAEYRNPNQIPARHVLVVGAANSGAQIAEDLAETHQVHLSQGARIQRLPRRVLGKSVHWYGDHLGLIAASLDSWRGRTQRGDTLIGTSLRQLERHHGVELVDRATDALERTITLNDGRQLEAETVIWATGYRPDYSWINAPVLSPRGLPVHDRGVTHPQGCTSSA